MQNCHSKIFKEKLWTKSESSIDKVTNTKLKYLIRATLIVAIITIVFGFFLVIREYIKGDYPIFGSQRIGAICDDGWRSYSTGRGTCSHHGGVDRWLYPQIGFHNMNAKPYWTTIASAFSFMIAFSLFSKAFRYQFFACSAEAGYGIGIIIYSAFLLATMPF